MGDLHGSLLLPVDKQREDHRTGRVRTQLTCGQPGLAHGADAPARGHPCRGLDVGESRDEQLGQLVEYLEAGSTAGLQGSDDRIDAADAERAEAPRATGTTEPLSGCSTRYLAPVPLRFGPSSDQPPALVDWFDRVRDRGGSGLRDGPGGSRRSVPAHATRRNRQGGGAPAVRALQAKANSPRGQCSQVGGHREQNNEVGDQGIHRLAGNGTGGSLSPSPRCGRRRR